MKLLLSFLLLLFHFSALTQDCNSAELIQRSIEAEITDANIEREPREHQVFLNPTCIQNGKLLVHLVGSFDNPSNTTLFPRLAANNGYKVINLRYRNEFAAVLTCGNSLDPNCYDDYRREIIFGEDLHPEVTVDYNNSILNRLIKLLIYLDAEYPDENWSDFINQDTITWNKIAVSGHSQGGGHAAYLGKEFEVDRVLMFASPNDYSDRLMASAVWLGFPSKTPISKYYAFGNYFDDAVEFENQVSNWQTMGLFLNSDSLLVDRKQCDDFNSKVLYTKKMSSGLITPNHSNVLIDDVTPVENDSILFVSVWEYMLGGCDVISSSQIMFNKINQNVNIYPNPSQGEVCFQAEREISKIEIFDIFGNKQKDLIPNSKIVNIDFGLTDGILICYIYFAGAAYPIVRKVVFN